ncbi:MAG: M20/M25/M40 family metallo-hydrolase [Chloroflexi bacterium]|nr:M20/M25/M40 family metallo-hydrolase [Chloroflexota bacterium]
MRLKTAFPWIFMLVGLALAALACNLSESAPPTLVPRATPTPPPTLGYATLAPEQLPAQATSAPQTQANMFTLLNEVNPERLLAHVQTLQGFGTRHFASPYDRPGFGIGAARDYVANQMQQISQQSQGNLSLTVQPFEFTYRDLPYVGYNVIGILNGTQPGAGVIIVGAHYDSISFDFENSTTNAPGANDNATGVAALLELARIISQRPHRQTIVFVAFGAEEIGRLGSMAFARDYVQAYNLPVMAMLNLDIIGSSTGPGGAMNERQIRLFSSGPNESPSRQLARMLDVFDLVYVPEIDIVVQDAEDRPGRYGDHLSFSEIGYPAVRFIEGLENPERQHNESDVLNALRPEYLTRATQTVLALLTALADGPRPPANVSLRDNGDGTRTLLWETVPEAASYLVMLRSVNALVYTDQFETTQNSVVWDGFVSTRYAGVTIASRDASGLLGPFSLEYIVP